MPETLPLPLKAVHLGKVASPQAMPEGVLPQRRAFAESGAANAVYRYDPFLVKKQIGKIRRLSRFTNKNILSADYAQSATTTTAASGGNREELLGQRPARRECRPRHDADAGCRNPIAEAISNRSLSVTF